VVYLLVVKNINLILTSLYLQIPSFYINLIILIASVIFQEFIKTHLYLFILPSFLVDLFFLSFLFIFKNITILKSDLNFVDST